MFNEAAQRHDGTQRFGATPFKGQLRPLAALVTQNSGATDPITARTQD
jgi:hypothetical protein